MPLKDSTYIKPFDTLSTHSIFEGHLLTKKSEKPQLHFTDFDFGIASILLLAFILFVWLYTSNRKKLNQIIKSFYINRYLNQLGRDELSLGNRVSIFLFFLFVLTFSLFIFQIVNFYGYHNKGHDLLFFMLILAAVCLIYGLKTMLIRLLGHIFQSQKAALDYTMMVLLFCNVLGLFLLPVVVCLAFAKDLSPLIFIYSGFGIFISFVVIRLIRGLLIAFNSFRVSPFYLFLYLCTLEILPFVILTKLFLITLK